MSAADVINGALAGDNLSFELLDEKGEVWGERTPTKRTGSGAVWEVVFNPRRLGVIERPWVRGFDGDSTEPQIIIQLREERIRVDTMIAAVRVVMDIPRMVDEANGKPVDPPSTEDPLPREIHDQIAKRIKEARKVGVRAIPMEIDTVEAITSALYGVGADLNRITDVAAGWRARAEKAEAHVEELQAKLDPEHSCACSYDHAGAVCGHHSPELARVIAERDATFALMLARAEKAEAESVRRTDLLREAGSLIAYMLEHGEWYSPEAVLARIDAELKGEAP